MFHSVGDKPVDSTLVELNSVAGSLNAGQNEGSKKRKLGDVEPSIDHRVQSAVNAASSFTQNSEGPRSKIVRTSSTSSVQENRSAKDEPSTSDPKNILDNNSRQPRYWTVDEHERFLEGVNLYGNDLKLIAKHVGTRNETQVRSHRQKYVEKIQKELKLLTLPKPKQKLVVYLSIEQQTQMMQQVQPKILEPVHVQPHLQPRLQPHLQPHLQTHIQQSYPYMPQSTQYLAHSTQMRQQAFQSNYQQQSYPNTPHPAQMMQLPPQQLPLQQLTQQKLEIEQQRMQSQTRELIRQQEEQSQTWEQDILQQEEQLQTWEHILQQEEQLRAQQRIKKIEEQLQSQKNIREQIERFQNQQQRLKEQEMVKRMAQEQSQAQNQQNLLKQQESQQQ